MVICYTPRPRLQPQEEVVAVVTWKKMWFPNTRTMKHCSSAAHSKTSRDIWIMSVWADELAAGTFVETQESVSSGLHMSAFPPLLIQTSFPRGTREEESYVQHNWDVLFSVLSLLWHIHQTKTVTIWENTVSFQATGAWSDRGWGVMHYLS